MKFRIPFDKRKFRYLINARAGGIDLFRKTLREKHKGVTAGKQKVSTNSLEQSLWRHYQRDNGFNPSLKYIEFWAEELGVSPRELMLDPEDITHIDDLLYLKSRSYEQNINQNKSQMQKLVRILPDSSSHPPDYKLIIFDVDGTLIRIPRKKDNLTYSWVLLWEYLGLKTANLSSKRDPHRIGLDAVTKHQKLTYPQWCDYCCKYFNKTIHEDERYKELFDKAYSEKESIPNQYIRASILHQRDFKEIARECYPVDGIADFFKFTNKNRIKVALISGGINEFLYSVIPFITDFIPDDLIFINKMAWNSNGTLNKIYPTTFDHEKKEDGIRHVSSKFEIDLEQTIFIGDNINDISAAKTGCLTVALNSQSEELKKAFDMNITTNNLSDLSKLFFKNLHGKI